MKFRIFKGSRSEATQAMPTAPQPELLKRGDTYEKFGQLAAAALQATTEDNIEPQTGHTAISVGCEDFDVAMSIASGIWVTTPDYRMERASTISAEAIVRHLGRTVHYMMASSVYDQETNRHTARVLIDLNPAEPFF